MLLNLLYFSRKRSALSTSQERQNLYSTCWYAFIFLTVLWKRHLSWTLNTPSDIELNCKLDGIQNGQSGWFTIQYETSETDRLEISQLEFTKINAREINPEILVPNKDDKDQGRLLILMSNSWSTWKIIHPSNIQFFLCVLVLAVMSNLTIASSTPCSAIAHALQEPETSLYLPSALPEETETTQHYRNEVRKTHWSSLF